MLEPVGAGETTARAHLRVGGGSVARHQLGIALALGCERVVCISAQADADMIALQHTAENGGARFHVIRGARGLMGLITATDDVLAFAEGLLVSRSDIEPLLEQGNGVFVQPVEAGLAAGFERVDGAHAAAGMIRIPGRLVERLAELPEDCDALSALQRIALQAGVAQRPLPDGLHTSGRWLMIRDEAEAHAAERDWIRLHTGPSQSDTASAVLARQAVRAFGAALLHANSGSTALVLGAVATGLMALGAGWFAYPALGFFLAALAWALRRTASVLSRVEEDTLHKARPLVSRESWFEWGVDGLIATIAAWSASSAIDPVSGVEGLPIGASAWFAPLMLVAMIRLAPRIVRRRGADWLGDRMLLALVLAAAAVGGVLTPAIQVLALAVALLAIAFPPPADG